MHRCTQHKHHGYHFPSYINHPGKKAGGTTNYGDYNILILEHLASICDESEEQIADVARKVMFTHKNVAIKINSFIQMKAKQAIEKVKEEADESTANAMVLGAYKGLRSLNKEWLKSLEQYEYCESLLNRLPLLQKS